MTKRSFIVPILLLLAVMVGVSEIATAGGELKKVSLSVEGMICGGCPAVVKKALEGLDGIKEVTVSFKQKRADVLYDAKKVTIQDMISTVDRIGFKAKMMEERNERDLR